ncbi:MAG: hypothetical protein ACUVRM_00475 [Bacillota bacterium]
MSCSRLVLVGLILVALVLVGVLSWAAGPWEGFETESTAWRAADRSWTDNNATGVALATEYASEGKQSLKLSFFGPGLKACAYIDKDMDLSNAKAVMLDLYNATSGGKVAVAVCTGDSWKWQESQMIEVGPGWNKGLSFDLTSANWKSADTGWAYVAKPVDLDKVKRFVVLFWEGLEKSGAVYIDNIIFVGIAAEGTGVEEGAAAPITPSLTLTGRLTPKAVNVYTEPNPWACIDLIENGGGWYWENWSSPGEVSTSTEHVTAGSTSVKLTKITETGDVAFTTDFSNPNNPMNWQENWSDIIAVAFDVYNDTGQEIAAEFLVRNNWNWDPIGGITIPEGASTIVISIAAKARDDVRALTFRFFSMPQDTSIYLDNLRSKTSTAYRLPLPHITCG